MEETDPATPQAPRSKLDRKMLLVLLGFCAGLGLLVALNMK